jgi:hypothetical protein
MAQTTARTATLQLNNTTHPTLVRVGLPPQITQPELARLTEHIVQNIVRPHTGCTCMSGTISVLFESVFQQAIDVSV